MDRFFSNSYKGDPGVPHSNPECFENIWIGACTFSVFSAVSWVSPYFSKQPNSYKLQDKELLYEQSYWKRRAVESKKNELSWPKVIEKIKSWTTKKEDNV
ncbi:hypothetical protein ZOSMA_2G02780 [Zostera marina]|uniref:Uncharacterized protein n=1 Tax=Zostera marina TaxID=29655 RepID=A0A0K9PDF6_ZOSMR|nr:hypothetical protein ZOSMA_2G02780 [Zostera marina]